MNAHQTAELADIHLNTAAGFEGLMELPKVSYLAVWEAFPFYPPL